MLNRVTITGADDSVSPAHLVEITKRFPFVEWGILLSRRREGVPRFPSLKWLEELYKSRADIRMNLSGHLCGGWVRELCAGELSFVKDRPEIAKVFQRVQLNFHAEQYVVNTVGSKPYKFVKALKEWGVSEYIFQFDNVNNLLMEIATSSGIKAVPLFDTSGGAGIEPGEWPKPCANYCGYAGGLHPDRVNEQIPRILKAAGDNRIWIDIETHVRSDDDQLFDLDKVGKFLSSVETYVNGRILPQSSPEELKKLFELKGYRWYYIEAGMDFLEKSDDIIKRSMPPEYYINRRTFKQLTAQVVESHIKGYQPKSWIVPISNVIRYIDWDFCTELAEIVTSKHFDKEGI